ncbi:HD domain-containing phosphohydrolase [Massilia sp. TN1-12]|uniref:HD domain-containing phosphohydrolase n=1 Tax=Massilia paldalensis TaxID=3377675 RepID=UPI00384B2F1C
MQPDHTVSVDDAVHLLVMIGDLSMGQPTDQSIRTARLAERIALADGAGRAGCAHARLVALLRWSGCTANAPGFATLLGDDVGGRDAMLRHALPPGHPLNFATVAPLARIHCEVAGDIAGMLGLPAEVEAGLRHVWEWHDGSGTPQGLRAPAIPAVVYVTSLSGDLEILARTRGLDDALHMIRAWGGSKYPAALAELAARHAAGWLAELDAPACPADEPLLTRQVPLMLIADMIELKLPWLTGYSRRVAELAQRAAALAGLAPEQQRCLGRAALIHGIGRVAVPNTVWERAGKLGSADWEAVHLVPYWTARAGTQVPALRAEAALASHVYERLDGSGYFRNLDAEALAMPQRLLAAAGAHAALCAARPWRAACGEDEAARILADEARAGRFDADAVALVVNAAGGQAPAAPARKGVLSEREIEVLKRISLGDSNKEAARVMQISPSTVRTHIESIFRKLECSTRAAATLKGLTLGLI